MEGASFYNPSWDSSMDQGDPFHSALTSIVSSPVADPSNLLLDADNNSMIRELIGRLGSICNSRDSASFPGACSVPNSAAPSSYSTPLNSPPKLGLSMMERNSRSSSSLGYPGSHLPLPSDSGFVERAARFSCFGGRNVIGVQDHHSGFSGLPLRQVERANSGRFSRVLSSQNVSAEARNGYSPKNVETWHSPEGSSISEQIPRLSEANSSRKRKFLPRGKAKESPGTSSSKDAEDCGENERPGEKKSKDDNVKPPEPLKDYIHVRARRGQATDSHSLAERVRREKISQRMKVLQDLVPGCNKVTGKAVMLDEIVNYVQSLQRQVEFLSMKLATLNPRTDFNVEAFVSKEMCNPHGSSLFPANSSSSAFPYGYHPHQAMQLHDALGSNMENQFPFNALNVAVHPSMDGFCDASTTAVSGLWDDELHSVVQMGLPQNQPPQRLRGSIAAAAGQMKIEL